MKRKYRHIKGMEDIASATLSDIFTVSRLTFKVKKTIQYLNNTFNSMLTLF